MQMLSPSSTIYLCGLLPIRPKSYNLLTRAIHIQHSLEQYTLPIASNTARVPFSRWVSVFHANRGRQCCLLSFPSGIGHSLSLALPCCVGLKCVSFLWAQNGWSWGVGRDWYWEHVSCLVCDGHTLDMGACVTCFLASFLPFPLVLCCPTRQPTSVIYWNPAPATEKLSFHFYFMVLKAQFSTWKTVK